MLKAEMQTASVNEGNWRSRLAPGQEAALSAQAPRNDESRVTGPGLLSSIPGLCDCPVCYNTLFTQCPSLEEKLDDFPTNTLRRGFHLPQVTQSLGGQEGSRNCFSQLQQCGLVATGRGFLQTAPPRAGLQSQSHSMLESSPAPACLIQVVGPLLRFCLLKDKECSQFMS